MFLLYSDGNYLGLGMSVGKMGGVTSTSSSLDRGYYHTFCWEVRLLWLDCTLALIAQYFAFYLALHASRLVREVAIPIR